MPTIAALVSFINSQPADRTVNNYNWNSCIIGDFAVEALKQDRYNISELVAKPLYQDGGTSDTFAVDYYDAPASEKETLMDLLNNSKFKTYGEAQEYLKENA